MSADTAAISATPEISRFTIPLDVPDMQIGDFLHDLGLGSLYGDIGRYGGVRRVLVVGICLDI
jgi:hypothetical protein